MANFKIYEQVDVSVPGHHCLITICRDGLKFPKLLQTIVKSPQALIVTNHTVSPLYARYVQDALAEIQCDLLILKDGEQYKNQQSLFAIYDALVEKKHHRDTTLIALGGGVIGDMAGFAAATYQRGVNFIQIPTTLLAQVDASVGGKTGINHPQGKNMIGSFYQPQSVLIDVATLATLPPREFRAGLAEMIKYGLLAGGEFLAQLQAALKEGLTAAHPQLPHLIAQCCRIKARIVEADEKEQSNRALLNLGHTFGHALEAYTHYEHWLHGEAVAIGLYCAALLSHDIGLLEEQWVHEIKEMIQDAGLPYQIPKNINLNKLRALMSLDKKIKNNCLRFVVIQKPGVCALEDKITEERLYSTLIAAV